MTLDEFYDNYVQIPYCQFQFVIKNFKEQIYNVTIVFNIIKRKLKNNSYTHYLIQRIEIASEFGRRVSCKVFNLITLPNLFVELDDDLTELLYSGNTQTKRLQIIKDKYWAWIEENIIFPIQTNNNLIVSS